MIVLYLNEKKKLCVRNDSENFEGENSFEKIKIISENKVSGHRLKDCAVECHVINPNGDGDIIRLAFVGRERPEAEFLLSGRYTAVNGELIVFLKIFAGDDVIGLTNEVVIKISNHRAVTSYIPEGQLTLLDQYSQTLKKAADILENGIDEQKINGYIREYLRNNEIVYELTEEDIKVLF